MDTQLIKGMLEGCILTLISHKEIYGYELLVELEKYGFENVGEGTFPSLEVITMFFRT